MRALKAQKIVKNVVYPEVVSSKLKSRTKALQAARIRHEKFVITPLKNSKILLPNTPPKVKKKSSNSNSTLQALIEDYGVIPDQKSCGGITVSSFALKSVICSGSWVDDFAIGAFI